MKIVFTGGGTGGHVYPGLALGDQLAKHENVELMWLGTRGRAEELILERRAKDPDQASIPIHFVPSAPFPGRHPLQLLSFAFTLGTGVLCSILFFLRQRPTLLIALGGYASAPGVIAAWILRCLHLSSVKILVHEQNANPGMMNRLASRLADLTALTFPEAASKLKGRTCYSGYPVRGEMQQLPSREEACKHFGLESERPILFVFGGSQGARSLNRALYAVLPELMKAGVQVLHAYGYTKSGDWNAQTEHDKALKALKISDMASRLGDYVAQPYFHDILKVYAAANLVMCRAGAGAIFEILAAGRAAVLVPKMGLPGDHQVANARRIAATGAGKLILEEIILDGDDLIPGIDPTTLQNLLLHLLVHDEIPAMEKAAQIQATPDALDDLTALALDLCAGRLPDPIPPSFADAGMELEAKSDPALQPLCDGAEGDLRDYLHYRAAAALLSPHWLRQNSGVKMAGLLRSKQLLPALLHIASNTEPASFMRRVLGEKLALRGFLRRNLATTFGRIGESSKPVLDWLLAHTKDPYWEVRVESIKSLAALEAGHLISEADLQVFLETGNFEEKLAALTWWDRFGSADQWEKLILPLAYSSNSKVRGRVLNVLQMRVERAELAADQLRPLLDGIPVTSTEFRPQFPLKTSMRSFARSLENESGGEEEQC